MLYDKKKLDDIIKTNDLQGLWGSLEDILQGALRDIYLKEYANRRAINTIEASITELINYVLEGTNTVIYHITEAEYITGEAYKLQELVQNGIIKPRGKSDEGLLKIGSYVLIDTTTNEIERLAGFQNALDEYKNIMPPRIKESILERIREYKTSSESALEVAKKTALQNIYTIQKHKNNIENILTQEKRESILELLGGTIEEQIRLGKPSYQALSENAKALEEVINNGLSYAFKDKNGRRWSFRRYADMLSREIQTQSFRDATVNRMLLHNLPLGKISTTKNCCDSCKPYQNRIISLRGRIGDIPSKAELQANKDHIFIFGCRHMIDVISTDDAVKELSKHLTNDEIREIMKLKV